MQEYEKEILDTASEADADNGIDAASVFSYGEGENVSGPVKPAKKGMVKKQIILISVFGALAIVLALVYFIVLRPIFNEKMDESKDDGPELIELIEGEVRDEGGVSVLMFPHVEKKNLNKITVKNPYGGYTMKREGTDNNFIIAEHPGAPLASETASKIAVSAGYSVIVSRLLDDATPEQLKEYGLGEGDSYTTVTVEDLSGNVYTYYVGNKITSAGGYYARYSTRNAVYIINADSASTLNQASMGLLSPMLGYPIGQDGATMIDLFAITKNGEDFITFSYDKAASEREVESIYKMSYPGDYLINSDTVASTVTATLASLEGSLVLEAGDGTREGLLYKNEKLMAQYGFHDLTNPAYELFYEYGDYVSYVIFADAGIEGYYYAYAYLWDTVVLVPKENVPYLAWDLLQYLSSNVFLDEIGNVDYIHVSGNIETAGKEYTVNEKLYYWKDAEGSLCSKAESTGWQYIGNNYSQQNHAQSFFLTVAMLTIEGYASEMGFDKSDAEGYAQMEIKLKDGTVNKYVFYKSGGYCYYELNGNGEFYVLTRKVNKVLIDAVRAANNCSVDWQAEYADYPSEGELLIKK